ncbi:MAG: xanthine dehydrogenase family protein subunit M [Clostridia bacterium]|nr:xanthine dehydrogenase family protein subunit M [Clostridia bacterium]
MTSRFLYEAPESFAQAASKLKACADARVILGGTDLMVLLEKNVISVEKVLDLTKIPNVRDITEREDHYLFGAGVTFAQLDQWAKAHPVYRALGEAAVSIGTPQVRNIATWVGNLCNAVPSCDMGAPSLIFDAKVQTIDAAGDVKWLPVRELFAGPKRTVLKHDELVTHIKLPMADGSARSSYQKFGPRKASDLAYVGVGVLLRRDAEGRVADLRIGLGAVGPTPLLVGGLERFVGQRLDDALCREIGDAAAQAAKPITDFRATEAYRRELVAVETERALRVCMDGLQ